MSNHRKTDQPSPTIVGPRPPSSGNKKISVPNGIEQALTLAAINPQWRSRILANAPQAVQDAGIHLTESEKAIVQSLPPTVLEKMIGSFTPKVPSTLNSILAAGVASAALLATSSCGHEKGPPTTGIRPDLPPPQNTQSAGDQAQTNALSWTRSLPETLAESKKSNRAVVVFFEEPKTDVVVIAGMFLGPEGLRLVGTPEVRQAVREANLLNAKVSKTDGPTERAAYEALIKTYALQDKLPAVVILTPDGSELAKVAPLMELAPLIEAIRQTPPLLAKWIASQREVSTPPATRGIQPGTPSPAGCPPDVPPSKDKK